MVYKALKDVKGYFHKQSGMYCNWDCSAVFALAVANHQTEIYSGPPPA
jgi:hypothetical protein